MICRHDNLGFPRRRDGVDYQRCNDCGALIRSKVQFGDFRPERMRADVEKHEREEKTAKAGA